MEHVLQEVKRAAQQFSGLFASAPDGLLCFSVWDLCESFIFFNFQFLHCQANETVV
uniref:Uncharacterized protein n=1 Tax=Anguilla anguilla TaxID=7936 RepID=A0A0E9XCX2_ANGAN